jgi:hypothetical protein
VVQKGVHNEHPVLLAKRYLDYSQAKQKVSLKQSMHPVILTKHFLQILIAPDTTKEYPISQAKQFVELKQEEQ